jgi:hypothetical protein
MTTVLGYWWVWFVGAAFFWVVQLVASMSEAREGQPWSIWRILAVTAMCVSLLIGVVRFVKWVWMWG